MDIFFDVDDFLDLEDLSDLRDHESLSILLSGVCKRLPRVRSEWFRLGEFFGLFWVLSTEERGSIGVSFV